MECVRRCGRDAVPACALSVAGGHTVRRACLRPADCRHTNLLTVLPKSLIFGNTVNIPKKKCDTFAKIRIFWQICQHKWIIMVDEIGFQRNLLTKS